jgi:hypothetical protein
LKIGLSFCDWLPKFVTRYRAFARDGNKPRADDSQYGDRQDAPEAPIQGVIKDDANERAIGKVTEL